MQITSSSVHDAERIGPSAASSAAFHVAADGTTDLGGVISILRRRIVRILFWTLLSLGLAGAYVLNATPVFKATTSLLIDPRANTPVGADPSPTRTGADIALLESQVRLLSSDTVLRRVARTEALVQDPEFAGGEPGWRDQVIALGDWAGLDGDLRERLGLLIGWRAVEAAPLTEQARLGRVVDELADHVAVRRSERTYVIDIDVSSRDAEKAARLANTLAKSYSDDQNEARLTTSRSEGEALRRRLQELQVRLTDAERRVEDYRARNRVARANDRLLNETQLGEVNEALSRARAQTAEARARHEQVLRILASGRDLDAIPDVARSPVLERLKAQAAEIARVEANLRLTLGPRHPQFREVQEQSRDTRRLLNEEARRAGATLKNNLDIARANETALERRLEGLRRETNSTNQSIVGLRDLEREVETARAIYDKFLRASGNVAQEGLDAPVARVIAAAVAPLRPVSPRKLPVLLLAGFGGLCLGVASALVREQSQRLRRRPDALRPPAGLVDTRAIVASETVLLSPEPAQRALQVQPMVELGPIPRLTSGVQLDPLSMDPLLAPLVEQPDSSFSRALVWFAELLSSGRSPAGADARPLVMLVTSLEPGTGKTVFAASLAQAYTRPGRRVLLIDGNVDHPTLSRCAPATSPSAVVKIAGKSRLVRALDHDWDAGLFLMPLGSTDAPPRPARTGAPAWNFGDAEKVFDLIVIDGSTVADPTLADSMRDAVQRIVLIERPTAPSAKNGSAKNDSAKNGDEVFGLVRLVEDQEAFWREIDRRNEGSGRKIAGPPSRQAA